MSGSDFVAIDWGTTNRRIFLMHGDGTVVDSARDDRGVLAIASADYREEFAKIRGRFGKLPIVAAGMVGSSVGFREAPYSPVPADIPALARGMVACDADVHLVPGICLREGGRADVMRGEEVQVLGALALGSFKGRGLFCQPGTHNKWIETEGTQITGFATALTGELFALLKTQSVLSAMLQGEVVDGPPFRDGLARGAGAKDLLTALFEGRAGALLGARSAEDTASWVSGVLVGSDVGSRGNLTGRKVVLLSEGGLSDLYTAAIENAGGAVERIDSQRAFLSGIAAIWSARR